MFDEIFDSKLSEADKQPLRLLLEAQNFSIAGTEIFSWILSVRHPALLLLRKAEVKPR